MSRQQQKIFRVTVASTDVDEFLAGCEKAEWYAFDTGERIMTDEGPDAEAVLLVEPECSTWARPPAAVMQ